MSSTPQPEGAVNHPIREGVHLRRFFGRLYGLHITGAGILNVCALLASAATLFGFLGNFWWPLDLFAHFRVQLFWMLLAAALLFLVQARYASVAAFGFFAVVNLCTIAALYRGDAASSGTASTQYRALLINVNTDSGRPDLVSQAIQQLKPDILLLEEISDQWVAALSEQLVPYRYSRVSTRDDNFGLGLYSRHPLGEGGVRYLGDADVPSVVTEIHTPGGSLTIIGTHPLPPANAENTRLRDNQLAQLPDVVKRARSPVLLLGDLNATPWCSAFKRLLRESGLRNSSQGRGIQATWPTFMPLLRIPIDHCLYGPGIRVISKRIGPNLGSDHYPVLIDFALESVSNSTQR